MANLLNLKTWTIDTEGIIMPPEKGGIIISKVILHPSAAGGHATFYSIDPGAFTDGSTTHFTNKTATFSDTTTLQSTGNFEATEIAAGNWIDLYYTSTGNNKQWLQVASRDNDNQVTIDALAAHWGTITAEANKTYCWKRHTPKKMFQIISSGTEAQDRSITFNGMDGFFPSLSVAAFSSVTAIELIMR